MKYEVDLPPDVAQSLSVRAVQTGQDVVHLIQMAVTQFVAGEVDGAADGEWTEEKESRRGQLIDRDIQGTITPAEQVELASLTREGNQHYDSVAPRPIDGAIRLHHQLLNRRASN